MPARHAHDEEQPMQHPARISIAILLAGVIAAAASALLASTEDAADDSDRDERV
jgi:hypothetical protein